LVCFFSVLINASNASSKGKAENPFWFLSSAIIMPLFCRFFRLWIISMFAVLSLVLMVSIGQIPELITGIPAIGYAFIIFHAITGSVALLIYEGRRWRIFTQGLLFSLIALLSIQIWTPTAALVAILTSFIIDVAFNSYYGIFKVKNKLFWGVIPSQV
jgi:hypothetical protein